MFYLFFLTAQNGIPSTGRIPAIPNMHHWLLICKTPCHTFFYHGPIHACTKGRLEAPTHHRSCETSYSAQNSKPPALFWFTDCRAVQKKNQRRPPRIATFVTFAIYRLTSTIIQMKKKCPAAKKQGITCGYMDLHGARIGSNTHLDPSPTAVRLENHFVVFCAFSPEPLSMCACQPAPSSTPLWRPRPPWCTAK